MTGPPATADRALRTLRSVDDVLGRWTWLLVSGPTLLLALWIVSPRSTLAGPSLVDDWSAISKSPQQVGDLVGLLSADGQRFRPAWVVWNYIQWHTLGTPASIDAANFWGAIRIALLVGGLLLATSLALRFAVGTVRLPLVVLPALLLVTIPAFGEDLARFGPQEPLLIGGMTLGGSLLFLAGREAVSERGSLRWVLALVSIGYPLWLLGVYQKELSITVVVLAAALLIGNRDTVMRGLAAIDRPTRAVVLGIAVAASAPLVHVAIATAQILQRGDLVYGAEVDAGSGAIQDTVRFLSRMNDVLVTRVGWVLLLAATFTVLASVVRRAPNWTAIGLLGTALAALAWSAQTGIVVTRYYMPTIALLAVVATMGLALLSRRVQLAVLIVLPLVVVASSIDGHRRVEQWATLERSGGDLVEAVARVQSTGCVVLTTGLDAERTEALPVLVGLRRPDGGRCPSSEEYLVLGGYSPSPIALERCPPDRRVRLGSWRLDIDTVKIFRCQANA